MFSLRQIKVVPFYFILGFAVSILYIYATYTPPHIIWHHPTPSNMGKVVYQDKANNCYRYLSEEVKCPDSDSVDHPMLIGT